jgi:hypothetical protein
VPLSPEQIQEHAKQLAEDHPADPNTERNNERACQRIRQVCSDLSEASELEQNTPPTSEWLLDNEYIVESNARRDMRLLRLDPSGVYPKMDFDTRDRYRRAVEELSRHSGQSEAQVRPTRLGARGASCRRREGG